MSTEVGLQEAFLEDGLERVSWWNGRILTAEDLADQQRASDDADRLLGRAVGPGVVRGLTARTGSDQRSVVVDAGLAVDRAGEVLALPREVRVPLVAVPGGSDDPEVAGFLTCEDLPAMLRATGDGAYLLTIGSAEGTRGSAAGADRRGTATRECGPRYQVAGVQFRLVWLDAEALADDAGHDASDQEVLRFEADHPRERNVVCALLLDTIARRSAAWEPFAPAASRPPLLDRLHDEGRLVDCEVPLAVLAWRSGAIAFTDTWAARRPPLAGRDPWPSAALDERGSAAGRATFQQFSHHLGELVGSATSSAGATLQSVDDSFRYLPPASLLHLPENLMASKEAPSTFVARGRSTRTSGGSRVPPGALWPLLRASLGSAPLDLDSQEAPQALRVGDSGRTWLLLSGDLVHLSGMQGEAVTHDEPAAEDVRDEEDGGRERPRWWRRP